MMNKKLLAALLLVGFGFNALAAEPKLKVGVEGAYPPFSEVQANGEVTGFDIDIAKALCAEMKRECDIVQVDWDGLIPALKSRKIDMIVASMSATEDRKKNIDFTDRYYRIPVKMVRKKGSDVDFSEEAMKGKTIGTQVSTTFDKHVTDLFEKVATIKRYTTTEEALLDLKAGRVDSVIAESLVLSDSFLKKPGGEDYELFGPDLVDEKYYGEGVAIGIRKKSDKLKTALNQAIKAIRENGVYKSINDKYFTFDVYGN